MLIGAGTVVLILLSIVPVWNATSLLNDPNFVFWQGRSIPNAMIILFVCIVLLYIGTMVLFFRRSQEHHRTESTILMIVTIFISLVGLSLMMVSLPLRREVHRTYDNILHRCDYSEQTHRLYEYSEVLQNIRATPACAKEYSVEKCVGFSAAPPFTGFLKVMESKFRCAGFCYKPLPAAASNKKAVKKTAKKKAAMISASAALEVEDAELEGSKTTYPPTLFSDQKFQSSCESMAARDLKNTAIDIADQTLFMGIYFSSIACACGFLKLLGFCFRKKLDA